MMFFSCSHSRTLSLCEHNSARAHSIACRRFTEIETIYGSYQDLLCNLAVIPSKRSLRSQARFLISLRRTLLLLLRRRWWLGKLRVIHRNVLLQLAHLDREPPARPRH